MGTLRAARALAALAGCAAIAGCAAGGMRSPDASVPAPDSSAAVWGDEHPGLLLETEEWVRPRRGASVDLHGGDARVVRVAATSNGVGVRASATPAHTLGMAEWRGEGAVRHLAAGYLRPSCAEGVVIGDPRRTDGPASGPSQAVRLLPAASPWGAVRGGGAILAAGRLRVSLAGWESVRTPGARAGVLGLEHRSGGTAAGALAALARRRTDAVSVFAARESPDASVAGEVALARDGPRVSARAALGERGSWCGALFAAAPRAADGADVTPGRTRHGGSVERRDAGAGLSSAIVLSTLMERDAAGELQRRRAAWSAGWRIDGGARLDVAARATRDVRRRFGSGPLVTVPEREVREEWRVRATLRARRDAGSGWRVENAYRVEVVDVRAGRAGVMANWTGSVEGAGVRVTVAAGGFALGPGQSAYTPNPGLVGDGAFSTLSGRGGSLSAAVRVSAGPRARVGATWAARGTARGRAGVYISIEL